MIQKISGTISQLYVLAHQFSIPWEPCLNSSLYILPGMSYGLSLRKISISPGAIRQTGRPKEAQERFGAQRPTEFDREVWLTRNEIRTAGLELAEDIASETKQLVFLFCRNTCETLIGRLAAVAARHAVVLIDPSLAEDKLSALIELYRPQLVLSAPEIGPKRGNHAAAWGPWRYYESSAGVVEWTSTDPGVPSADINPTLQLLLSTSGTTGSQKYVRLSRDAIVANAGQIADALAIDEQSIGIANLPSHYSYRLSVLTSHLAAGGRVYFVNDSITSPSSWSKIANVGGSHFRRIILAYY